jgi:hypothetical protein
MAKITNAAINGKIFRILPSTNDSCHQTLRRPGAQVEIRSRRGLALQSAETIDRVIFGLLKLHLPERSICCAWAQQVAAPISRAANTKTLLRTIAPFACLGQNRTDKTKPQRARGSATCDRGVLADRRSVRCRDQLLGMQMAQKVGYVVGIFERKADLEKAVYYRRHVRSDIVHGPAVGESGRMS